MPVLTASAPGPSHGDRGVTETISMPPHRLPLIPFCVAVSVLFASFAFNAFRVVSPEAIAEFAAESDQLVINAVYAARQGEGAMHGGFLVEVVDSAKARAAPLYRPVPGLELDRHGRSTYLSQFGLQGSVLSRI